MTEIMALEVCPAPDRLVVNCGGIRMHGQIACLSYEEFRTGAVDKVAPRTVLAPLIGDRFDIIDVAEFLGEKRFSGELCVVAGPLPDTGMVLRELERQFPHLNLYLISEDDLAHIMASRRRRAQA